MSESEHARRQFKDSATGSFTPNGRPTRKPRRIVMKLAEVDTTRLSQFLVCKQPSHTPSLQVCMESRPPLDPALLCNPSPATYNVDTSSLTSRGGVKLTVFPKYPRDKLPYSSSDDAWRLATSGVVGRAPSACTYNLPPLFGNTCPTVHSSPAFSMGQPPKPRLPNKCGCKQKHVGPQSYYWEKAALAIMTQSPSFTFPPQKSQPRRRPVTTPGPAHYNPSYYICHPCNPAFSMRCRTSTVR